LDAMLAGETFTPGPTMQEIVAKNSYNEAAKKDEPAKSGAAKDNAVKNEPKSTVPPKGTFDLSEADTASLVKMAGIDPGPIPSQYEFSDEHLSQFATYVIEQNIDSRTASALASWLLDKVVEGG